MAKEDDDLRRRREREDEAEVEDLERQRKKGIPIKGGQKGIEMDSGANLSLDHLLGRAETLIDQLDHLYNMYFAGADKLPPNEKRGLLEATIKQIENTPKLSPALQFRSSGIMTRFVTYREKWEKKLKAIEMGKIRRS